MTVRMNHARSAAQALATGALAISMLLAGGAAALPKSAVAQTQAYEPMTLAQNSTKTAKHSISKAKPAAAKTAKAQSAQTKKSEPKSDSAAKPAQQKAPAAAKKEDAAIAKAGAE